MPTSVTSGELLNSVNPLKEFAALDIPIKVGFKVQRILKRVSAEIDSINEMRNKIIEKFTEKDADGKAVHPLDADGKPENDKVKLTDVAQYTAEVAELYAIPVQFQFDRINPSELGEKVSVKSATLLALDWLFTDN